MVIAPQRTSSEDTFRVQGSGFRVQGSGFRVQGSGFRGQGSGFRVQGSGFRVQGSGFLLPATRLWEGTREEKMLCEGTYPESYVTDPESYTIKYTLVYEDG